MCRGLRNLQQSAAFFEPVILIQHGSVEEPSLASLSYHSSHSIPVLPKTRFNHNQFLLGQPDVPERSEWISILTVKQYTDQRKSFLETGLTVYSTSGHSRITGNKADNKMIIIEPNG